MSQEPSKQAAITVVGALEALRVGYMVVGSLSSNAWGIPRSTKDADFVIETDASVPAIRKALAPAYVMDDQMGFETVTGNVKYVFRNAMTGFEIELFLLSDDPFNQSRFKRRVHSEADGLWMWLPTAEDVIVQKLRWARPKDYLDVLDVMAVQEGRLDWEYITHWCKAHGSLELMAKARHESHM